MIEEYYNLPVITAYFTFVKYPVEIVIQKCQNSIIIFLNSVIVML